MTRTELPWKLWDRLVRPFPLAASFACGALAGTIYSDSSVWGVSSDMWSQITAAGCVIAVVALWIGWWAHSTTWMQHGLMLTTVLFSMRGTYIGLVSGNWWTSSLSYAWALAAGGAWLLERSTGHWDIGWGRRE